MKISLQLQKSIFNFSFFTCRMMVKQIFQSCQKTIYHSATLTILHLPQINSEPRWEHVRQ